MCTVRRIGRERSYTKWGDIDVFCGFVGCFDATRTTSFLHGTRGFDVIHRILHIGLSFIRRHWSDPKNTNTQNVRHKSAKKIDPAKKYNCSCTSLTAPANFTRRNVFLTGKFVGHPIPLRQISKCVNTNRVEFSRMIHTNQPIIRCFHFLDCVSTCSDPIQLHNLLLVLQAQAMAVN